jgi:hypothetical protein
VDVEEHWVARSPVGNLERKGGWCRYRRATHGPEIVSSWVVGQIEAVLGGMGSPTATQFVWIGTGVEEGPVRMAKRQSPVVSVEP